MGRRSNLPFSILPRQSRQSLHPQRLLPPPLRCETNVQECTLRGLRQPLGACLAAWAPRRANMGAAAAPRDPRSNPRPSPGSRAAVAAAVFLALVLALNASTQWQKRGEHAPCIAGIHEKTR